eukprot:13100738-Ditylum_brightwellii.AAC.1
MITENARRVMQSRREAVHKAQLDNHLTEKAVQQVTKNQLKVAMLKWLLVEIEDRDTGLNNVNIQDIFDHDVD